MRIIEPGHRYAMQHLESEGEEYLTFIRRSSKAVQYATEHAGTNTQEVIRVLIDRTKFLYGILPCDETLDALYYLRMALFCYEARAYRRSSQKQNREAGDHTERDDRYEDIPFTEYEIEKEPAGPNGHILKGAGGLHVSDSWRSSSGSSSDSSPEPSCSPSSKGMASS